MEINIGEIIIDEELIIGDIVANEELDIGNVEIDVMKIYPELEDIEIIPDIEEQSFKSTKYGYNEIKIKPIPDEYVIPKVIEKTLVLSRVNVQEGGLIL